MFLVAASSSGYLSAHSLNLFSSNLKYFQSLVCPAPNFAGTILAPKEIYLISATFSERKMPLEGSSFLIPDAMRIHIYSMLLPLDEIQLKCRISDLIAQENFCDRLVIDKITRLTGNDQSSAFQNIPSVRHA